MKRQIFLLSGLILLLASCQKEPGSYPPEPQIYYQKVIPNVMNLGDTISKIGITIGFNDGDGDIGTDPQEEKKSIFIKDSRDTTSLDYSYRYAFPYIEDYMRPKKGGLEGVITISLGKEYFLITDSLNLALRKDTLQFDIYVEDDAGHRSNTITTDPIYIEF